MFYPYTKWCSFLKLLHSEFFSHRFLFFSVGIQYFIKLNTLNAYFSHSVNFVKQLSSNSHGVSTFAAIFPHLFIVQLISLFLETRGSERLVQLVDTQIMPSHFSQICLLDLCHFNNFYFKQIYYRNPGVQVYFLNLVTLMQQFVIMNNNKKKITVCQNPLVQDKSTFIST